MPPPPPPPPIQRVRPRPRTESEYAQLSLEMNGTQRQLDFPDEEIRSYTFKPLTGPPFTVNLDSNMFVSELENTFPDFHFVSGGQTMNRDNQLKDYSTQISIMPKLRSGRGGTRRKRSNKRKTRRHRTR